MSIRIALHHKTAYHYDRPVVLSPQTVRLRPAPHGRMPIVSYSLKVQPGEHFVNWQQDPYSNYAARFVFQEPTEMLSVEVDLVADMIVVNPFDFFLDEYAEKYPFTYDAALKRQLAPFLEVEKPGPLLAAMIKKVSLLPRPSIDVIVDVNQIVHQALKYVIRLEPGVQEPEQTLQLKQGSCRDFAWLAVHVLRHLGLAARFVSGYSIQIKPDVKSLDGPSGVDADCADLHAWAEVFLPGAGWVGLDATCGLLAGEGYIPLACTPEPSGAAPLTGLLSPCESTLDFKMTVTRMHENPRATRPYTDAQWRAIDMAGRKVDEDLRLHDVRLMMGGEPTFVSIDDMDGEEWTVAAVGPAKRKLSEDLVRRLADRFAPGALLHFGQGKWYPGEPLPRWSLACYWRKDGGSFWHDSSRIADASINHGHTLDIAQRFIHRVANLLKVDPACAVPAYEPPGEPGGNLGPIAGYALPLYRNADPGWVTSKWTTESGKVVLIPGTSAMGLRLPIEKLISEAGAGFVYAQDPFDSRAPLPAGRMLHNYGDYDDSVIRQHHIEMEVEDTATTVTLHRAAISTATPPASPASRTMPWAIRTALAVEPRGGTLHVFYPPVARLEHFIELTEAIEDVAATLNVKVVLEGYAPPEDHRVNVVKVTPDPGVIEVNTHPSRSWTELVHRTTVLYDEARLSRLGAEKFMVDGRHTGTGGGNHIVLGGPTPAESPLLRKPDLLRSLLTFWNNHPSLSYLFSGTFIGPTSQAPRLDESRPEALYELEIAFSELPERNGQEPHTPPWLVDRIFRHLLTDVTGNTHRAEFCIDKLYSPDSPTGRLGLLEMRSLEMPPHSQMSLAQLLIIRAAVAWFWRHPYKMPLIRWGTALHDKFLLPHFVEQDMRQVVAELNTAGYPLKAEWFLPHMEFRFPHVGEVQYDGVSLELRNAIEPWNVLGEEPAGGATVRYVDSSVEKLQIKANGLINERYVIACNGRRVPMTSTGVPGEAVGGVRFRAWQPAHCLHPTIGVHHPLVFDVIDSWNGRSLGGCTYHVAHPGGRSYDTTPVNAKEAESRRRARFDAFGHTPGPVTVPVAEPNPLYPHTLDLRRPH